MELSGFSGLNGSYLVFPGTIHDKYELRSRKLVGANLCTFSNTSVNLARYVRSLLCFSLSFEFRDRFEISRYLAKTLENQTNIDRLIYIKDTYFATGILIRIRNIYGSLTLVMGCGSPNRNQYQSAPSVWKLPLRNKHI